MPAFIIPAIGACVALCLAIGVWFRDKAGTLKNRYLSLSAAMIGLVLLEGALITGHVYDLSPFLFGWSFPAFAFLGPFLSLYFESISDERGPSWQRGRTHVTVAAVLLLTLIPWYFAGGKARWLIDNGLPAPGLTGTAAVTAIVFYILASALLLLLCLVASFARAQSVANLGLRQWIVRLLQIALVCWGFYAAQLLASLFGVANDMTVGLLNLLLTIGLATVALLMAIRPADVHAAEAAPMPPSQKYERSAVDRQELEAIMMRVQRVVELEKIHRESSLTLSKLSSAVRTKPNRLSQALNVCAGGFHEWLAKTRIQDALVVMETGEGSGLLDIAYLVGFNSKSTFYQAFKRETGVTPAVWLKQRMSMIPSDQ